MPDDLAQPPITTTLETRDGEAVLRVAGEIDLLTAPDFISALGEAQSAGGRLLVDLTDVSFMDSTGLRALLEARRRADGDGAVIALQVLDRAGVSRLFAPAAGGPDAGGPDAAGPSPG
jgi:anti-anti-sigma factor